MLFRSASPAAKPLSSFSEALARQGAAQAARFSQFGEETPSAQARAAFGLKNQDTVISMTRVRQCQGEPTACEQITIPTSVAPDLQETDVTGTSIGEALRKKYGIELTRSHETLRVGSLDKDAAEALGARAGSPAFVLERQTFAGERLVELREISIRPDRFQFELAPAPVDLERD